MEVGAPMSPPQVDEAKEVHFISSGSSFLKPILLAHVLVNLATMSLFMSTQMGYGY